MTKPLQRRDTRHSGEGWTPRPASHARSPLTPFTLSQSASHYHTPTNGAHDPPIWFLHTRSFLMSAFSFLFSAGVGRTRAGRCSIQSICGERALLLYA